MSSITAIVYNIGFPYSPSCAIYFSSVARGIQPRGTRRRSLGCRNWTILGLRQTLGRQTITQIARNISPLGLQNAAAARGIRCKLHDPLGLILHKVPERAAGWRGFNAALSTVSKPKMRIPKTAGSRINPVNLRAPISLSSRSREERAGGEEALSPGSWAGLQLLARLKLTE